MFLIILNNLTSVVFGATIVASLLLYRWLPHQQQLDKIPAIGSPNPLLSYIDGIRFIFHGEQLMREAYYKYKPGVFKIPYIRQWMVVVAGSQLVEEVRKAPDDVLNFHEGNIRLLQMRYAMGQEVVDSQYHVEVIKSKLTRSISTLLPVVHEELVAAFDDVLSKCQSDEWVQLDMQRALQIIISRATNRTFVGLPLCRNKDYINLTVDHAYETFHGILRLHFLPDFIKPAIGTFVTRLPQKVDRAAKHLGPIIEKRLHMQKEFGDDWEDKPNDLLQWILDESKNQPPAQQTLRDYTLRILLLNFAAIHTTTTAFQLVLFYLAAHPEYADALREEITSVVCATGWSKASLSKMRKLDSFIRESQRVDNNLINMTRFVDKPFTLSNGITIPSGVYITCLAQEMHHDSEHYQDADTFDPWRFSKMREHEGEGTKYQLSATSREHIVFGHGKHACPGRFFAASEMKLMLSHIILNYDVKLADERVPCHKAFLYLSMMPTNIPFRFRKRAA